MAEWSKAPRSGRGPHLRARVRIPLLTKIRLLCFSCCVSRLLSAAFPTFRSRSSLSAKQFAADCITFFRGSVHFWPGLERGVGQGHSTKKQSGAVEACWAHNPEVRRSKLRSARTFLISFCTFLFVPGWGPLGCCVEVKARNKLSKKRTKNSAGQGAHGVEPWTYRSAVDCSTTELYSQS